MKSPLRAAVFQMRTTDDIEANADKIHAAVARASEAGAELLVVPECALSGYLPDADVDLDLLQHEQQRISRCVSEHALWLALGTVERGRSGLLNAALLISPQGETVASYHKTELTETDVSVFIPGDSLGVFQVGEWRVGLQICFDMRFPENWRLLRLMGAELVLHLSNASRSSAWKVPVLEGTIRCRAAENGFFVVSANDARAPQMMVSAMCDPDGKHLATARLNNEAMILAELDRTKVKDDFIRQRRTDLWRKPEYSSLFFSRADSPPPLQPDQA